MGCTARIYMIQQRALASKAAKAILACIRKDFSSRLREVILPLCSALVRPHTECWVQCWAPQYMDILEGVQQRANEDD